MSLRIRIARVVVLGGVLAMTLGVLPAVAGAESCPNEEIRAEQGAERLPDCRAFELVTPEVKGDNSTIGSLFGNSYGFPDGDHVYYASLLPLPGARSGGFENVLSARTASGWVNTALAPPAGQGEPIGLFSEGANNTVDEVAFTGDFSAAFLNSPFDTDPQDQDGAIDAYRVDLSSDAWSLATLPDTGPMMKSFNAEPSEAAGTYAAGVSEDGRHVLFETMDQLPVAPGTPSEPHAANMLYDRTGGHTYAVGVLPDGTIPPTCEVELGDGVKNSDIQGQLNYGAISPDGSNVVFTTYVTYRGACPSPGVYLRKNNATTVQLPGQTYIARSSGGSKVITAGGGLYEYDVVSGTTTTITAEGNFVASSADGARVYYLTGSGLYFWDSGTSTLIPKAGEGFANLVITGGLQFANEPDYAVATPDGSKLLFLDKANLTGYDSFGPTCQEGHPGLCNEAYVYDATTASITCVSCNPTGAPPLGVRFGTHLMGLSQNNTLLPAYSEGEISPDGSRAFFETEDALVPQDTNGLPDVYEWEKGRIYLISSGQGTSGSTFSGASSKGDDVLVTTTDHLAPQDIENSTQIYDARVGGGFPYKPFTTGCDSGQCQGPQTPAPVFGTPASATFTGLGNPAPAVATSAVKVKPMAKSRKGPKRKPRKRKNRKAGHTGRQAGKSNGKRQGRK